MSRERRKFLTAAFQRRQDPFYFQVDDAELRGVDNLDLADIGPQLAEVQELMAKGVRDDPTAAARLMDVARDVVGMFIHADSRREWDRVKPDVDPQTLLAIIFHCVEEYTGVNPTSPSDASTSSPTTGDGSTGGASNEGSTPSDSAPATPSTPTWQPSAPSPYESAMRTSGTS